MEVVGTQAHSCGSMLPSPIIIRLKQLMQTLLEVPDPGFDASVMHEAPRSKAARAIR